MSIDSIVSLAAQKIGEILVQEGKLLYGVEDQVHSLQNELTMMNSYLIDVDEGGDERLRTTIKQIREIAYDAEDVIESYVLEFSSAAKKKDLDWVKRYVCFCCSIPRIHQLASEIEAIKVRIVETMERWRKYLGENEIIRSDAKEGLKGIRVKKPISYAYNNEEHVVGLDEDINKLVGVLTNEECSKIKVISFVGMGGSGKTTLARKLYNHNCIKNHFDCVAWVSVSEQWVVRQILLELLRKAGGETMRTGEALSLAELVEKLHQSLESKKYLIILDDVWTKQALEEILPTLPFVNDGRKIIVTTRKREVVDFPDLKCFIHEPRRLSEGESWDLFRKIALIHREESNSSMDGTVFEALGKEMLKKCEGLPLAVVALAGILSKKETLEEWEKIKKAVSSRIMDEGRGTHLYGPVNEMLALSYNDLPRELKPCFLYLAIFPEDLEIKVGQLIGMWIAEGFITPDNLHEDEPLEDVGRGYLDELIHRCVVQIARKSYQGKVKSIRIHDLVRDLCIKKAKQQDFLEIFTSKSPHPDSRVTKSRRAVIISHDRYVSFPTKSQHLRSLIYLVGNKIEDNQKLSLEVMHQDFRLLRVLNLSGIETCNSRLPSGIGSLIHLRSLVLRWTNITELPSSIGNLRNLLTLDYRDVDAADGRTSNSDDVIIRIPDVVWKIEGLRHLFLPISSGVVVETFKLNTFNCLHTLSMGVGGGHWMLEELPRLCPSVQKLSINGIRSQDQLEAVFQCPSIRLDRLYSLRLGCQGEDIKMGNLEPIIHCHHLRRLFLHGRMGLSSIQFPANIMKLVLWRTGLEAEAMLVGLGKLPQLTILRLWNEAYRGIRWTVSVGEFPQLKELKMDGLENLEEWSIERGAMPQLGKLEIWRCGKLRKVPEGLKFITTLQELILLKMGNEFTESIKGGGEDAHIIPLLRIFP